MKRIYHLSSCTTNQRMLKELKPGKDIEMVDIKENNIDAATLDWLKEKMGSYEALFSKKALKYRSMGLDKMKLSEEDYRRYMLEEYTFLKRPFIIMEDKVLVGNTKRTLEDAKGMLKNY